jgi:hypothetical protein
MQYPQSRNERSRITVTVRLPEDEEEIVPLTRWQALRRKLADIWSSVAGVRIKCVGRIGAEGVIRRLRLQCRVPCAILRPMPNDRHEYKSAHRLKMADYAFGFNPPHELLSPALA